MCMALDVREEDISPKELDGLHAALLDIEDGLFSPPIDLPGFGRPLIAPRQARLHFAGSNGTHLCYPIPFPACVWACLLPTKLSDTVIVCFPSANEVSSKLSPTNLSSSVLTVGCEVCTTGCFDNIPWGPAGDLSVARRALLPLPELYLRLYPGLKTREGNRDGSGEG